MLYVCLVDQDKPQDRHLALAFLGGDSEALCGQRIAVGRPVEWFHAMRMTNCAVCREAVASFRPAGVAVRAMARA